MRTILRTVLFGVAGLVVFGLLLFVPAGTFDYWQAWLFLAVFALITWIPSIYLLRTNPAVLKRRMRAGPTAETRPVQKVVMVFALASLAAMTVVSVLDHRFGWSRVPAAISLVGDLLVACGLGAAMLVIIQNSYAAATVTVEAGQKLVCTGLYGLVRHPMYTGNVIMMVGLPLALGSYSGLLLVPPSLLTLVFRILDEEKALAEELDGYRAYMQQVRYRLVPHVW
ncbi:isoprenylcysteine carboxylmethyltransferase family protein [Mycobacterium simiae]|uniref:Isoprenylcysteine carboxylmethyltransferase family protein n=1 Tax=Mycobacterium simiae TaxID=1784 RepID=A0A5B1BQ20_MYCSI|nr:isoprenylcysteine carboxylmethyltransferase family protein [Mycobacterium simiae]KAA1250546.1 isoprenylcysteine carboxylmethyltransferase family protein [Mycobacterium simiae]